MDLFYILLAVAAGILAPVQAGINSQLRSLMHDPFFASMISFAVGTLVLLLYVLLLRVPWPAYQTVLQMPLWMWAGGIFGAFFVAVTVILAPKLGAATMIAFMITGQMLGSLLLDHFGLVGYEIHPVSKWRLLGGILLLSGAVLIRKF